VFSFIKAEAPTSTDLHHEYRLMVNNEVLMLAIFTFLLRLFDKGNVQRYYFQDEHDGNEIVNNGQIPNLRFFLRAAKIVKIQFPVPVLQYEKASIIAEKYNKLAKKDQKKGRKSYKKLDESALSKTNEDEPNDFIFSVYKSDNGFKKTEVTDFRIKDSKTSPNDYLPADLFEDAYCGNNCFEMEPKKIGILGKTFGKENPLLMINPEYFIINEVEECLKAGKRYNEKKVNFEAISVLKLSNS
jgi:hypothetical protein